MRLLPRSLHTRLLALSALAIAAALLVAAWTIAGVLERFVVEGLDRRLDSEVTLLASAVDRDGRVDRVLLRERLATLAAGPGWRWRIAGPDGTIGSEDFPLLRPGPPGSFPPPGADLRALDGADARERVHARQAVIATQRGSVTVTAAAPRDVVRRPIRGALTPLLVALAALAVLLAGATLLQLRLGLRPLRRLRDEVAAMRAGTRERADEDQPTELRGLAIELNALADDNRRALAAARLSAANLAHALKTPVATLALDLRHEPARAAQVARIDATIRHHLARARLDAADRRAAVPLAPAVADLVTVLERLHAGRTLAFTVDVPGDLRLALDPRDLDELVGNLLDNAAKHARACVRVSAVRAGRSATLTIADDGPGIALADRQRVREPGLRLDEQADGHGFGLSIVAGLASLYGGAIALDDAPEGGLAAHLTLPIAAE